MPLHRTDEFHSKFRGVSYNPHTGKYEARICVEGRHYYLGLFYDDISAAIVYDVFCVRLGVPRRSNGAADEYANETPVEGVIKAEPCEACNNRGYITSQHLEDGRWVRGEAIPCPLCHNSTS